ncbi:MAG: carboxy-S-adenosyl-L-methionine synthase CmoA [Candidatus Margulisbacteria bacterium]|nr:carboxy-S-adenosyl-L-methionine synthase CmoA [Candidatus Margulisiibacteriota bacterium]
MKQDKIYRKPLSDIPPFSFNQEVADVFDDMINRSVPCYKELQYLLGKFALKFYQEKTQIYDLGCSTGETLYRIASQSQKKMKLTGVDSSAQMLAKAGVKCRKFPFIKFVEADLLSFEPEPCSVIIITYVLQFIPPSKRLKLLKKLFDSLLPGGIILLSEKILADHNQQTFFNLYAQFKLDNKYTELEIRQKREALENVLISYTIKENIGLLKKAGFKTAEPFFQYLNFCAMLAVK